MLILSPNRLKQKMKQVTTQEYLKHAWHVEHDERLMVYKRGNQCIFVLEETAVLMILGNDHYVDCDFFAPYFKEEE